MGLRPEVARAVSEMGFIDPMPVQRIAWRRVMAGRDLMIQSRTGSGKTAAFGIPMAQGLLDPQEAETQALALCPTRELALQVANECGRIGVHVGLRVAAIYGGAPMGKQIEALKEGAHIVAGTPGRVLDHLRRGTLKLGRLRILVLDEADEMLSMGFYEEISEILKRCPTERQTLLFSATIPEDIERIASRYMRSPEKVSLSSDHVGPQEITHAYYLVPGMGRTRDLVRVLRIEKPDSAIIFCNTRDETGLVSEYLRREGMDAEAISSDLTQADRERVMGRMREGNLHYLVATDIAARGIDISDLSHVINYTFPESAEIYVHRTGRTGRAGKKGVAISLVSPRELGSFYYLKLTYKIRPEERLLPSEGEEATRRDGERLEHLVRELGGGVGEEWRRLARRVWAAEAGEAMVGALLERFFRPRAAAAPVRAAAAAEPLAAAEAGPATEAQPERHENRERGRRDDRRDARGGRERGGRDDRKRGSTRERRPRDEAPRRHAPQDEAPASATRESGGPAMTARESAGPAMTARESGAPALATHESGAAIEGTTSIPVLPVEAARGASPASPAEGERQPSERRRRRRRGEPGERGGGRPAPARGGRTGASTPGGAATPGAPTIDIDDGREFWEVWADDRTEPTAGEPTPPPPAAPTGTAATPTATATSTPTATVEAIPPGCVRLYLGLGRRDGLQPDEVERFVRDRGVDFQSAQVRSSYTYLIIDETKADEAVAALDRQRHGDREMVCERARKS